MAETTVALIFAAAAPTIVALATFMAQMRGNTKNDKIHELVNSGHDELKKEVADLKRELRASNRRADAFAAQLDMIAKGKNAPAGGTGAAGSEPTPAA